MSDTQNPEMAATTSVAADRVMATAQNIVMSFNTAKDVRDDMLSIFSGFDKRLSNINGFITSQKTPQIRFDEAEKIILQCESEEEEEEEEEEEDSEHRLLWDEKPYEQGHEYLEALGEILELIDDPEIQSNPEVIDRAESLIQMAMSRLEDEFRHILITNTVLLDAGNIHWSVQNILLSFPLNIEQIDDSLSSPAEGDSESVSYHERGVSLVDELSVDFINSNAVMELKEIVDRMIQFGYEKECRRIYTSIRSDALDECLAIIGFEMLSIEELQMIDSKDLDKITKKWIQALKVSARVLFPGEKKLCDQIFNNSDSAKELSFKETVKGSIVQLLNFGEGIAIMRVSYEKLFLILNMYEALANVIPNLEEMLPGDFLISEARRVLTGFAVAAKGMFSDFEDIVHCEASWNPMTGGEIHTLTRYVMSYMEVIMAYSETLNSLLDLDSYELSELKIDDGDDLMLDGISPIGRHLVLWISYLESNLEEISTQYEDGGMQYIFLMNNIWYIVQKVKDSDLGKLLGDLWVRKHRGLIRQYATSYLRASWSKVLSCLNTEGLSGSSGNASMLAVKEKFRNFNERFEDLYMVQTSWKVPDPQLREELRISISEQVIPAYRSFVGRFASQLDKGRHAGKYVKYSTDDLETYFLDLFEGSGGALPCARRKAPEDGSPL